MFVVISISSALAGGSYWQPVATKLPPGCHLVATWLPPVATWLPPGCHLVATGCHLVATWLPPVATGCHLVATWLPPVATWLPPGGYLGATSWACVFLLVALAKIRLHLLLLACYW